MVNSSFKSVAKCLKNLAYCIFGSGLLMGLLILTVVSLPIFLYRWIVCQVFAPLCGRDLGKAVTVASSATATELKNEWGRSHPRTAIVVTIVLEGEIKFEEITDIVQRNWISAEGLPAGTLKYPEFQQYVESWMGYMFWKQDRFFDLANHLTHHKCEESWSESECEQYARSVTEDLLNKPFPKRMSPWETHVISHYRNSEMLPEGKEMTSLTFRFHHCLSDGYGIFSALIEGLWGIPLSKCAITSIKKPKSGSTSSCFKKLLRLASFPIRAMRDGGYAATLTLFPVRTPWYIPEGQRIGQQFYTRSGKLPLSKLKFVKDKFGVSLSATIISIIAAGIASSFKAKGFPNRIKGLPFGSAIPLKGHSYKLRNHATAVLYEVPIDQLLSPLERLKKSERNYQNAKQSTFQYLGLFAMKLSAAQLPFLSKQILTNRTLSSAMTNFPGPRIPVSGFGRNIIGMDFGAGLIYGVAGLAFMILSYHDHIRIAIVAENAAMERNELEDLVNAISAEIDDLYQLAKENKCVEINMTE